MLASGKVTAQQAQRSYFLAARIAAADSLSDPAQRAALLRQAISIHPAGLAGATGFSADELRLKIVRAEAAAGQNAAALDAIQTLVSGSNSYAAQVDEMEEGADPSTAQAGKIEAEENEGDVADGTVNDDTTGASEEGVTTLADLERAAPLPARSAVTDAEKVALARLIAQVYEDAGNLESAMAYLKLGAYLEKDSKLHADLESHASRLQAALALEAENASRRPHIQSGLNQSGVVRPRLSAAEFARREAQ